VIIGLQTDNHAGIWQWLGLWLGTGSWDLNCWNEHLLFGSHSEVENSFRRTED